MSFKKFIGELNGEGVEGELVKTVFVSLLTSIIVLVALYWFRFRNYEGFIDNYGLFLLLSALSYAVILPSIKQVRAYKEFPCMSGMMIGMTIGMLSGFLPGFYLGATNGMFWGSIFGMAIGIFAGVYNGKCCGIMGVLEGIMAGFMGGLMGAMTAVMMYNDNLRIAAIIMFLIGGAILFGLNYMIYKETREMEVKHRDSELFIVVSSFILMIVTFLFMVIGPRSVLLQ